MPLNNSYEFKTVLDNALKTNSEETVMKGEGSKCSSLRLIGAIYNASIYYNE